MKIVVLHTDLRLYWPARLKNLSDRLKLVGHEFTVIEISGKGSPYAFSENTDQPEINWTCLYPEDRMEDLNSVQAKKAVLKILNEINPDVVISGAFAFTSGAAAINWAKANNKAVILFDDAKKEQVKRSFLTNLIKRFFYHYVDAILCPAEDWLPTYTYWGIPEQSVFYGVDVVDNKFWETQKERSNSINLPDKFLLCVGRQIARKNFSLVIDVYTKYCVDNSAFEYHLVLVGDGPMRKELVQSIDQSIAEKIYFLPFQSQESLREIYHQASFFILPSIMEPWGLVANEAMASGLPVIISRQCGCTSSLVKDGLNGFTFDAYAPSELLSIFERITKMEMQELQVMRDESRKIIKDWGLDKFSKGTCNAINYVTSHSRRKPFYWFGKFLLKKWTGRYNQI